MATACNSFSKLTDGLRSIEPPSVMACSVTPTQSTSTKCVLVVGVGRDRLEVGGVDDAHATALHLLEEVAALDRAHEHDDFQRLDVGAGGDHVDGDDDARVVGVAELLQQILGLLAGGAVGHLPAEVVPLAELLPHDLHDVVGVVVVLGEDQRLRHLGAAGEDLGEELLLEGADDGADLVGRDHVAVERAGVVGQVVVELLPALGPRQPSRLPTKKPASIVEPDPVIRVRIR